MKVVVIPTLMGCALITGCTVVTYNDGDKVSIDHDFWLEEVQVLMEAAKACQQAGKAKAVKVMQVDKGGGAVRKGVGVQISTYQCQP